MKQKFKYILVAIAAVLLMSSCHSLRRTSGKGGAETEQVRFETAVNNAYKYEALQSKVKLTLGKTTLNGKMSLESGKRFAMQINAPLLGFELGRIEATAQSVLIVDKFDKLYSEVTLSDLTKADAVAGHEMEAVECLMLGRIFIPSVGQASAKDFSRLAWSTPAKADGTAGNSLGVYEGRNYRLVYELDSNGRVVSTTLSMADGKEAQWQYGNYTEVASQKWVATTESIQALYSEGKSLKASFSMNNPALEENTWKEFTPTSSFRRVTVGEMVEVLKQHM